MSVTINGTDITVSFNGADPLLGILAFDGKGRPDVKLHEAAVEKFTARGGFFRGRTYDGPEVDRG